MFFALINNAFLSQHKYLLDLYHLNSSELILDNVFFNYLHYFVFISYILYIVFTVYSYILCHFFLGYIFQVRP